MSRTARATLGLVLALGFSAGALSAQEPTPAQIHLAHILEKFPSAPGGQGLLQVALADAQVAAQHAALGAQNPNDLASMQRHANHVIHALDPRRIEEGPGSGYGTFIAAGLIARHAELAGRAEGATNGMRTHATHVSTSARNTERRADRIVAIAQIIAEHVDTAADAAKLFGELRTLADQLVAGVDANGDGQVGWQEGEGGLQIVQQHADFMRQAATASSGP